MSEALRKGETGARSRAAPVEALAAEVRLHLRDQFRCARANVLKDAEAFTSVVQVVERAGQLLAGKGTGMGAYGAVLTAFAAASPLAETIPDQHPAYHLHFERLFDLLREARNLAVHEGALARNITIRSIELALVLEDALMPQTATAKDYMIRGPLTAEPWQPLSFVRQTMLANSFSYLPMRGSNGNWMLVSDHALAKYLGQSRASRLRQTLQMAINEGLAVAKAETVEPTAEIADLRQRIQGTPVLVVRGAEQELLGIITAFDML